MTIADTPPTTTPSSAVIWVDDYRAIAAETDAAGRARTCTIERGGAPEPSYIGLVVRAIGDRERVVILGPGAIRLELEREYVSIYRRPDHLVDVEPAGQLDEADLVDRLHQLAG